MKIIAHIKSEFPTKFGIPRQSGLVKELRSVIVFEPEYRNIDAFRGLEAFSHIWIIWEFSEVKQKAWHPTVRPPRLGGNMRMGVFATRSPFRPNPIGLSCVEVVKIEMDSELGPVIIVSGADLMDGTPIYDIKPYLPYVDSHPEARGGFAEEHKDYELKIEIPESLGMQLSSEEYVALCGILKGDPRPSYQNDPDRIYGFEFAGYEIRFSVEAEILKVVDIMRKI